MATSSAAQPGSVARLQHAFALRLDVNVLPGRAVIGRFDGEHVALALANPGGTVTVHWSDRSDKPQVGPVVGIAHHLQRANVSCRWSA